MQFEWFEFNWSFSRFIWYRSILTHRCNWTTLHSVDMNAAVIFSFVIVFLYISSFFILFFSLLNILFYRVYVCKNFILFSFFSFFLPFFFFVFIFISKTYIILQKITIYSLKMNKTIKMKESVTFYSWY